METWDENDLGIPPTVSGSSPPHVTVRPSLSRVGETDANAQLLLSLLPNPISENSLPRPRARIRRRPSPLQRLLAFTPFVRLATSNGYLGRCQCSGNLVPQRGFARNSALAHHSGVTHPFAFRRRPAGVFRGRLFARRRAQEAILLRLGAFPGDPVFTAETAVSADSSKNVRGVRAVDENA